MATSPHIVVIGGGYAGIMAARTAVDRGGRVTVIDADGRHGFLPRLATVAAGGGPEADADAPLASLLTDVGVETGHVVAVEHASRLVKLADGGAVGYDALVVAAGAQGEPPPIPGLVDWAWQLRTPDDARRLRARLAGAESLVIVGAGATGTQLAGEVAIAHPNLRVTLTELSHRILPNLPRSLARRAAAVLAGRDVHMRTGVELAEVGPDGATLADGSRLPGLVVWAGGFSTRGQAILPDAELVEGRVAVEASTRVPDHGPVLAAGDLAAHRGPDGSLLPQTAQVAVRAGKLAGANAVRLAEGRRARAGTLRHIGWVLPLGGGQAVAKVGPLALADPISGQLAPFLHDAIDLRHLLTVGGLPAAVAHHQAY